MLGASLALLAATPVFADGGDSGTGSAGGTDAATGAGGSGVSGTAGGGGGAGQTGGDGGNGGGSAGGAGGASPGANGANAGNGGSSGAGGGGGGAHGQVLSTLPGQAYTGGDGGSGGSSAGGNGGGGAGGYGAVITGSSLSGTLAFPMTGGTGGNSGLTVSPASGGSGGIGLMFTGSSNEVTISGTITGGDGGASRGNNTPGFTEAGAGGAGLSVGGTGNVLTIDGTIVGGTGGTGFLAATQGAGGVGITGSNADITITASGNVSGGLSGDVSPTQANAITFTGGTNNLTIESGYTITGNVVGTGSDKFTFGGSTSASFDLDLFNTQFSGFSTLGKTGTSTWTLTNGTVASSLDIDAGKLQFGASSVLSANADVASGATLSFNQTGSTTYSNVISGAGNVEQENAAGTLIFSTNQTYTGTTTIAGTLQLGSGGTTGGISSSSDIINNGALIVNRSNAVTLGNVSGNGTLTKQAAGTLTFIGDTTFSSVSVTGGGLQVGNGGGTGTIAGDIALSSGTALTFNRTGTFSYADDVTGGGSFTKSGTGTVIATGSFGNTGGITISAGTMQFGNGGSTGSFDGDVTNNATIDINRSGTFTYDDDMSGSGSVTISGPGRVVFSGTNTYSGDTTITNGTLSVNGQIGDASATTEVDGGKLGGTGTILGTVDVNSGGTLGPGNSIGTLNVTGNVNFATGSSFEVEIAPNGTSDLLAVDGIVTIIGGTALVVAPSGNYVPGTIYTIITATGGVTGQFTTLDTSLAFITPEIEYLSNSVVLEVARNATTFSDVARTSNQSRVASALQNLSPGNPLYDAVVGQTVAGAQQAFNAMSGEVHATVSSTLANDSHFTRDILLGRLVQAHYAGGNGSGTQVAGLGSGGPKTAAALDDGPMMGLGMGSDGIDDARSATASPITFWAQGYGAWADFGGNATAAAADRTLGGFLSGMDAMLAHGWRVGGAIGYARTDVSVGGGRYSSADVDSYQLAAYTSGEVGSLVVRGGTVWSWDDIDTERSVVFPGFYENAEASYDGTTGQVFGEVALPLAHAHVTYEPFAGLAWVGVHTDGLTETGGNAALTVHGSTENIGYMSLGLRAAGSMVVHGAEIIPRGSIAWLHAFGDVESDKGLAFAAYGQSFDVTGLPLVEDSALVDAGFDVRMSPNATAGIFYTGQFGDAVSDNAVSGRLNWKF
jgi:outer membrane autotransporter protein